MKKMVTLATTLAIALAMVVMMAACGSSSNETPTEAENQTEEQVGMPNPWSEAKSAEEAAKGAGVGSFEVIADGTEIDNGPVSWSGYQYMEGLAEADGSVGAAELIERKGNNQNGEDVSGDYNEYSLQWEIEVDGQKVTCAGNEQGKVKKAIWTSGDYCYSIMVRAQGDDEELLNTFGLGEADITTLVSATK